MLYALFLSAPSTPFGQQGRCVSEQGDTYLYRNILVEDMSVSRYFWLGAGIFLVVVGVWLLFDFLFEFAKLVVGIIFLVLGLQFIAAGRRPRVRVR